MFNRLWNYKRESLDAFHVAIRVVILVDVNGVAGAGHQILVGKGFRKDLLGDTHPGLDVFGCLDGDVDILTRYRIGSIYDTAAGHASHEFQRHERRGAYNGVFIDLQRGKFVCDTLSGGDSDEQAGENCHQTQNDEKLLAELHLILLLRIWVMPQERLLTVREPGLQTSGKYGEIPPIKDVVLGWLSKK
jgi:hypothetical protein